LGYLKTGVYAAFGEPAAAGSPASLIVLTDMHGTAEFLLEGAASTLLERGAQIVVAQIGAAWRVGNSLRQAFVEYEANYRTLQRLEQLDLTILDVRPETLIETIAQHIGEHYIPSLA